MGRLDGKVALITGAGSGVGRAAAAIFAREGARVTGVSRTAAALEETGALLRQNGHDFGHSAQDISLAPGAEAAMAAVLAQHGRIDILLNAAGVGYSWQRQSPGSMEDVAATDPAKWDEVMRINLTSCYLMSRLAVQQMRRQGGGGALVHVASVSGFRGLPRAHAYCAAKAGMINLSNAMSCAYVAEGIRSNVVAPGYIATGMVESLLEGFDDPAQARQMSPMQRPGRPEEIAAGCLFLASDEASYCSGSVLVIDGGMTAMQG
ncbi:short-chain dehydrogenase [Gemmobacter nanjingensis]|uniref:Short-chain dehydrogenase n=1 Tax=Gemmobacter nanjingensis TaxID=488454 RepID=A0ABQ3FI61_9RHOB|nr:SDR family oxidoreductase [Gemmobacter nanjingensis]GHC24919.1 short-chain dehydrogenase [Gemmobacter nanjingensis]